MAKESNVELGTYQARRRIKARYHGEVTVMCEAGRHFMLRKGPNADGLYYAVFQQSMGIWMHPDELAVTAELVVQHEMGHYEE